MTQAPWEQLSEVLGRRLVLMLGAGTAMSLAWVTLAAAAQRVLEAVAARRVIRSARIGSRAPTRPTHEGEQWNNG